MANFDAGRSRGILTISLASFALLLSLLSGGWIEGRADVAGAQKREVQHLIDFLSHSGCRMERNGKPHDAEEAVRHIVRKYNYYRDRIQTTEDFITLAATRSLLSGRSYRVLCNGKESRLMADWLKIELDRYRKNRAGL